MKSRFFLVCLAFGASTAALAADAPASVSAGVLRPGPPPIERLVKPLAMTEAQQAKLRPVFQQAQAQAIQDVNESDPKQLAATLRMHDTDFRMRLSAVLTPAQLSHYEQLTANDRPGVQDSETHGAHGHHETDTPATASEHN